MKREKYEEKMSDILNLPQFEKVVQTRKNAKHPVSKEHEQVCKKLLDLQKNGKIDAELYTKLYPNRKSTSKNVWPSKSSQNNSTYSTGLVNARISIAQHSFAMHRVAFCSRRMSNKLINKVNLRLTSINQVR